MVKYSFLGQRVDFNGPSTLGFSSYFILNSVKKNATFFVRMKQIYVEDKKWGMKFWKRILRAGLTRHETSLPPFHLTLVLR